MLKYVLLTALAATSIVPSQGHAPSVPADVRVAENRRWQSLGITVPGGGIVRPDPFAAPYDNRSFVVPFDWYKTYYKQLRAKQPVAVSASALRQDLPILHFILSKAYSGYASAEKRGWKWNDMFAGWDAQLRGYGNQTIPLEKAFAPWGKLEKLQLDNHSGVPGLMAFVSGSRSAVLAGAPSGSCTSLNFEGGSKQPLLEGDAGQQPHAAYSWHGSLDRAYYMSYPEALGSAVSVTCGAKEFPLSSIAAATDAPKEAQFKELSAGIAYLRMPTFSDLNDETIRKALKSSAQLAQDRVVVFDLRGNDGGNAPLDVLSSFLDDATLTKASQLNQTGTKSCFRTGLFFGLQQQLASSLTPPIDASLRSQLQSMIDSLNGRTTPDCRVEPTTTSGGPSLSAHHFEPGSRVRFIVLVDAGCGSDCEYLTYVLANVPNSVIVGQSTYGVMGFTQPGYTVLPHSGIPFRLALSRTEAYGDGRSVDGYGITADIVLPDAASQSLQSITDLAKSLSGR